MKSKFMEMFKNGFFKGTGIAAGLFATGLFAAAVTGTINSFSAGGVIDATQFNTNFATLKTAIEAIDPRYSTTETATHRTWIDGKTIYRKVVNIGTLPNATLKAVAHGITGMTHVIRIGGYADNGAIFYRLPHASITASNSIQVDMDATNIGIRTGTNLTAYSGFVVIEYVK